MGGRESRSAVTQLLRNWHWSCPSVACWLNGRFDWGLELLYFFFTLNFYLSMASYPDAAVDRQKLGVNKKYSSSRLNQIVHVSILVLDGVKSSKAVAIIRKCILFSTNVDNYCATFFMNGKNIILAWNDKQWLPNKFFNNAVGLGKE